MYAYCRLLRPTRLQVLLFAGFVTLLIITSVSAQSDSMRPFPADGYSINPHIDSLTPRLPRPEKTSGENVWTLTSSTNAPTATYRASAVWTGSEMIVWGGYTIYNVPVNVGGRYNPTTDTWQPTATAGAPSPRYGHVAIWTGTEMLIWGGQQTTINNTGGRYNLSTNEWRSMTTTNAPPPQINGYQAVWTGQEMLAWGTQGSGGLYDPKLDRWRPITTDGAPVPVPDGFEPALAVVWTGNEAIVFYSSVASGQVSGGRYDPVTDTWRSISLTNAPRVDVNPAVVWTGKEMLVYGGLSTFTIASGGRYNPQTDSWKTVSANLESATLAVWTGTDVILLAGHNQIKGNGLFAVRYDLDRDQSLELPAQECHFSYPTPFGVGVWANTEILTWGAQGCAGESVGALRLSLPYRATKHYSVYADTYIASGKPTQYFGTDPLLFNGWDPKYGYGIERMLVQFETNQIPSRVTIENAVVYLYLYAYNSGATTMNVSVHRATSPWHEGSTWNTANNFYDPAPSAIVAVGNTFGWYGWNVTPVAQGWKQGVPDYGFTFFGNSSGGWNERAFIAREAGVAEVPYLSVTTLDPFYAADTIPPLAFIAGALPAGQPAATPLLVEWTGSDQGRGIQNFDVQLRDESAGVWNDWYTWAVGKSAYFTGVSGHTYCFRVRARDYAGNVGDWSTDNRCTTFYTHAVTGAIVDHHHTPVANASLQVQPAALMMTINPLSGQYALYFADDQPRQMTVTQPAYTAPPAANIVVTATDHYDFVMQPIDNVILNSNFESSLTSWTMSGTLPVGTTNFSHSGNLAAVLNSEFTSTTGIVSIVQSLAIPTVDAPQVLSFMYNLTTTLPLSNSQLAVTLVTTDTTSTIWRTQASCTLWCHAWVDISAWRGQVVTLTVVLTQASSETLQATLDEIVLGSWQTPLIEQIVPSRIDAHISTVITLIGQNFLAEPLSSNYITGPTVLLDITPIETYWITTNTLSATVPITMPFGLYTVWVNNPGGFNAALPASLRIGHAIILPIVAKNH